MDRWITVVAVLVLAGCATSADFLATFDEWERRVECKPKSGFVWTLDDMRLNRVLGAKAHRHESFLIEKLKMNPRVSLILDASPRLCGKHGVPPVKLDQHGAYVLGSRQQLWLAATRAEMSDTEIRLHFWDTVRKPVRNVVTSSFAVWEGNPFGEPTLSKLGNRRSGSSNTVGLLEGREIFGDHRVPVVICALQHELGMIGLHYIAPDVWGGEFDVIMHPACKVHGEIARFGEEKQRDLLLEQAEVRVVWKRWVPFTLRRCAGFFGFPLPPGEYTLKIAGGGIETNERQFTVPPAHAELDLGRIDFEATPLGTLYGRRAPEFSHIRGWLNSEALSLSKLRGKVVVLFFWRSSCSTCQAFMPVFLDLDKNYRDQGLCVIGVHDDSIGSVEELAEEISSLSRKYEWENSVTFPIALDGGGKTTIEGTDIKAPATTAAYGVTGVPTAVLIDRKGFVAREMRARNVSAHIEALLRERPDSQ